jgi:hypothetical protein
MIGMTEREPERTQQRNRYTPVCAIGASAGGVGALQGLFRMLPVDLGFAYVIILHLAPDHPSSLHEILGSCTSMSVQQVTGSPALKPNCVYVIPPGRELVIDGEAITARPFSTPEANARPSTCSSALSLLLVATALLLSCQASGGRSPRKPWSGLPPKTDMPTASTYFGSARSHQPVCCLECSRPVTLSCHLLCKLRHLPRRRAVLQPASPSLFAGDLRHGDPDGRPPRRRPGHG